MKKVLVVLLTLALLVGCGQPTSQKEYTVSEKLTVLSPKGAPALGLLGYYKEALNDDVITTVDGTDALTAAFTQVDGGYDMVIAPVNLGATLVSKQATDYRLAAIVTWGNLYIVSDQKNASIYNVNDIAAFGQFAVPGKMLSTLIDTEAANTTWFNAVSDVASALISGKYHTGLVAEPVCSNVLNKATELSIVVDVQDVWKTATGYENYPQAALWVKQSAYDSKKDAFEGIFHALETYVPMDEAALHVDMDQVGQEALGVASAMVSMDTYARMNVKFVKATEQKEAIESFLRLFDLDDFDDLYLK